MEALTRTLAACTLAFACSAELQERATDRNAAGLRRSETSTTGVTTTLDSPRRRDVELTAAPFLKTGWTPPFTTEASVGVPQLLWEGPGALHHCRFSEAPLGVACVDVGFALLEDEEPSGPIATYGPGAAFSVYKREDDGGGSRVLSIDGTELAGNTSSEFLREDGTVLAIAGLELRHIGARNRKLHTFDPSVNTQLLDGDVIELVRFDGEMFISILGPDDRVRQRMKVGKQEGDPWTCAAADGTAALFLDTGGHATLKREVRAHLRGGGRWMALGVLAGLEPSGGRPFPRCGDGKISLTTLTDERVDVIRCTKTGCSHSGTKLTTPIRWPLAAELGPLVVLTELPMAEPNKQGPVRLRVAEIDALDEAPAKILECKGAAPEDTTNVELLPGRDGVFIVLQRNSEIGCAFYVGPGGTVKPVPRVAG